MTRSPWSVAGEALFTVVMLVGPPFLATRMEWPLGEDTTWVWLLQYLRGGTVPSAAVIAASMVGLWGVWAFHLVIVALDIVAVVRGVVPRVGLVRLVWVLVAGGATATTTHTAALAAHTDTVAEAPVTPATDLAEEPEDISEEREQGQRLIDRTRTLSGFGFDSAEMTPSMQDSLEPTLGMIDDFGLVGAPVVITGHTDPVGHPTYNQALSERRAQAVADYLADHLGEEVELQVAGAGSTQPRDVPGASYAAHRRVEIAYTLQPPNTGESQRKDEPQKKQEAPEPVPEQVQLDVTTSSGHDGPSPLLVGAVAGAAGMGAAGYAVGLRRARAGAARPEAKAFGRGPAPDRPEDSRTETEHDVDPGDGELVRHDPGGIEGDVIDSDGYMLVGGTARVDTARGVAFVGAHAAPVLAAVVSGHGGRGPVIATRAVVEALGGEDVFPLGTHVVADLPGARIVVEAALLACARQSMDDEHPEGDVPGNAFALVVSTAIEVHGTHGIHRVLREAPGVVMSVLGEPAEPGTVVHCDRIEEARVTSDQGHQVYVAGPLRHRVRPGHPSVPDEEESFASEPADHQPVSEAEPGPALETALFTPPATAVEETDSTSNASPVPRVRVRLFAPQPVCEVDGDDVLARSSSRLLLAMLALCPRGLPESQMSEVLSPGKDETKSRKDRYNAITGLRAPLREALKTQERILFKKNGRYFLQADLFDIDVVHAKALRGRVDHVVEDREMILRELAHIWEKPLLSDCEDTWFEPHRKHYADQFVEVLVLLAKEADAAESRVSFLQKAMELDRFNESIYQDIMHAYNEMGRPDAVRRTHRSLEKALGELKKKPSPASEQLLDELTRPDSRAQG
ncbi:OmpA family protein [Nocardiopsis sp. N85]|uniref:OmpA family protein n=1 Tax=Nocardiopsis sp. N85 TaxID=3029400 RepID=UPI00237F86C0|nr:OmpA family protein [Nocardiopsis sp. N85]MDE3721450.1 OmpA family protein [Nocardiopsis sp. N85]